MFFCPVNNMNYLGPISQMVYELRTQILWKFVVAFAWKIIIRSGHNFAHATTAELLWHVQNCDRIVYLELKLQQRNFA